MQTQCPHCDTKFRVTENQLQAADGFVRCGVCEEVFNTSTVIDTATETETETETGNQETFSSGIAFDSINDEALFSDENIESDTINSDEISNPETNKEIYDLFDAEDNESQQHIVPEKYRDTYSPQPHSLLSTVLWSLGILALTATLTLEYIWFNRSQFMPVPELQTVFGQLCQHVECSDSSMRDPDKIELITRNIYSHPKEKNALLIDVVMKNNAPFAQPFPIIQIDFSDIRGGTVAARRFYPDEYLPSDTQTSLLKPNANTSVSLEIQDPGKQAMTYEFNFL